MSEKLAIETQDLTKRYDGVTVVDRLNLHVRENEVFGLLGPNGAGKTTTILMLLGLTEPASGTARVCGFNSIRDPLKVKRLVGYLPEKVGFYENLTPRENLRFIAELNNIGYAEANRRADEVLEMIGLTDRANQTVGKFSRGMKQRLGIADVLIKKPKVALTPSISSCQLKQITSARLHLALYNSKNLKKSVWLNGEKVGLIPIGNSFAPQSIKIPPEKFNLIKMKNIIEIENPAKEQFLIGGLHLEIILKGDKKSYTNVSPYLYTTSKQWDDWGVKELCYFKPEEMIGPITLKFQGKQHK